MSDVTKPLLYAGSGAAGTRTRVRAADLDPEIAETYNVAAIEGRGGGGSGGRRTARRSSSAGAAGVPPPHTTHHRRGSTTSGSHIRQGSLDFLAEFGGNVFEDYGPSLLSSTSGASDRRGAPQSSGPAEKWKRLAARALAQKRTSETEAGAAVEDIKKGEMPTLLNSIAWDALRQHREETNFEGILEVIRDDDEDEYRGYGEQAEVEEQAEGQRGGGTKTDATAAQPGVYGSIGDSAADDEEQEEPPRRFSTRMQSTWKRMLLHCPTLPEEHFHPWNVLLSICNSLARSLVVWVSLPLSILAVILFYCLGNPTLIFFPGTATAAWCLNFAARQAVTLEIARLTQYLVIDVVMLSDFSVSYLFGASITAFYCILSRGWCFIVAAWAIWDLLLLQGSGTFQLHWLCWTGLRIYSQEANSGKYIIESEFYLRLLVALILLGIATALKRTILAIRFGRLQIRDYKPQLEKILKDVVLISELSYIAEQAQLFGDAGVSFDIKDISAAISEANRRYLHSVGFDEDDDASDNSGSSDENDDIQEREKEQEGKGEAGEGTEKVDAKVEKPTGKSEFPSEPVLERTGSGNINIKDMLDRWEEPVSKDAKVYSTVNDVVKFRRVLHALDEAHPFGKAFGPAGDRDECIESSHHLFFRLLKLSPSAAAIPFSTILLAAIDEQEFGQVDESKVKGLRRLFRPDAENMIPMVPFIQSIDTVYKKMRFFRASIDNASAINNVLAGVTNSVFFFCAFLLLLLFLQINPWPLLVSLTSLLVSVSFALGPSVSKFVEGALLIAVRHPFDLGDRIYFSNHQTAEVPGPRFSWFVEDFNLTSTTLRYNGSNEVSTINNSALVGSRIVNCNRSPNAVVIINVTLHISFLERGKLTAFQNALKAYLKEQTRAWDRLIFIRNEEIDADNEKVLVKLAFIHRNSWQDAPRILLHRGYLLKFIHETTEDLGIDYCSPASRRLLYSGGVLIDGRHGEGGYKSKLLDAKNIKSFSSSSKPPDALQSFAMIQAQGTS